ncbi:MAG: hypothetical protein R3F49_25380, partial [Planctomycetota bacterium]
QGQEIFRQDQDGTVLEKGYDLSGRILTDAASTLGTNIDDLSIGTDIDGAVRLKEFAYDGLGRMITATQRDATTSGSIVDQVEYTYGEWGRMTSFAQDVDSAVTGGSGIAAHTCSMDYTRSWAATTPASRSGARTVIPASVTLPGGTFYSFNQDTSGYHEHAARTNSVKDGVPTIVASFEFVGDRRVSRLDLHVHDFVMDYSDGAGGGSYADWDQFNRVIEDEWYKDLATDRTFLHRQYTLDEGGFIEEIYDYIEKNTSNVRQMDTLLTMDGLNRLTNLQRGTLSGTISNETMEWTRTLDAVGNMSNYKLDWTGDNDYVDADEYDSDVTFSAANEIEEIDAVGATYSKSGMLLDDLRLDYVYDAWGRIVEVKNATGGAALALYRRSAADHLIGEQLDRDLDLDIDANDYWEYFLTRPSDMGMLASFRGSDADPLVERLWLAELHSKATGSFGASAVLESRDDDYDGAGDRETVLFIDRTGSVIGCYGDDPSAGKQVERLFYNMTSQPVLMPWGDVDGDGDSDASDTGWVNILWSFSLYDVRADLDLDGDVDSIDYAAHASWAGGVQVSNDANCLSSRAHHTRFGILHAHHRGMQSTFGTWTTRGSGIHLDGGNLYTASQFNNMVIGGGLQRGPLRFTSVGDPGQGQHSPMALAALETCQGDEPGVVQGFEAFPIIDPSGVVPAGVRQAQNRRIPSNHDDSYFVVALNFLTTNNDAENNPCGSKPCQWNLQWAIFVWQYEADGSGPKRVEVDSIQYKEWHGRGDWPRTTQGGSPPGSVINVNPPNSDQAGGSEPHGSADLEAACTGGSGPWNSSCVDYTIQMEGAPFGGHSASFTLRFCCRCYAQL